MRNKLNIFMDICVVVYTIGQIFLVAGKLAGHIECSWAFALSPTITAVFACVITFIACVYMVDEASKIEEDDMKMRDNKPVFGGVGIFDLLGAMFIVLKLTGVISWSWWMVLAPFWIPMVLVVVAFVIKHIAK